MYEDNDCAEPEDFNFKLELEGIQEQDNFPIDLTKIQKKVI